MINATESAQDISTAKTGLPPLEISPARLTASPSTAMAWRILGVLIYSTFW